jgi:hypothetical protein
MAADYVVTATQPYTYLNPQGQVVNGYRVFFTITKFGENHQVDVPTLDKEVVKRAVEVVVKQRNDISTF